MMKNGLWFRLLVIVLSVLGLVSCCRGAGVRVKDGSDRNLVQELQASTVVIVGETPNGWRVRCGGVWVNGNQFLTARHCISEDEDNAKAGLLIRFKVRKEVNIKKGGITLGAARWGLVKAVSKTQDLALVSVIDGIGDGIGVGLGSVRVGDRVIVMGHTGGLLYNYLEGMVAGEREDFAEEGDKFLVVDARVWHGNSGGGVFDKGGRLVGICSFLVKGLPGHVFFVHVDKVREFLEEEGVVLN